MIVGSREHRDSTFYSLVLSLGLLFFLSSPLWSQTDEPEDLFLSIIPRVINDQNQVFWEKTLSQVTKSGKPVVVKLESDNLYLKVTVTPFLRDSQVFLVVEGVVRLKRDGNSFRTTMQTLTVPLGEKLVFFPLGRDSQSNHGHQILVEITVDKSHE